MTLAAGAIKALDHTCWVLTKDGQATTDGEEEPHYESEEKALAALAGRNQWRDEGDKLDLVAVQLDRTCLVLSTVCGYTLDEDGDGICHSDDRQSLFDWAMGYGFALLPDGSMLCGPERCEVCAAVEAGETAELEPMPIAGQLTIGGGEVTEADVINLGTRRRLRP